MYLFVWLISFCSPILLAAKDPTVQVVLNDIQIENNAKDIVALFDVHLVTFQGRRALSGALRYNIVIPNTYIQFTLSFVKPDKTRFNMLDLWIDSCSFLNGTYNKLKIPCLILKELKKQKGLPHKCPMEANKTFTIENYEFLIPEFPLPNLKFICAATVYMPDKKRKIISARVKGATKRFRN